MSGQDPLGPVGAYYEGKLRAHGTTPRGVDWNSADSQELRFRVLAQLFEGPAPFSVIDYGCGYGALVEFLDAQGRVFDYTGFDVSSAMVAAAVEGHRARARCVFTTDAARLEPADYTVASGIFNVKLDAAEAEWRDHLLATLDRIDGLSRRGFAFNCLTSYADPERMRADLYYADPGALFHHCKTRYSRRVSLLHDYPLYEFTILVRKEGGVP